MAWTAVLFTGRFPRGLFDLLAGVVRWNRRMQAYTSLR
ncbi:MAG: hypothetical protein NZ695_06545 [Dehalococcoidia bacterium]|nr:hypothetical protein [Dehalococcoidia bacterium]MDW8008145.1 hypothetical protein [Chloroflexota bacterium]